MINNRLFKIICSLPFILLFLYLIPFLGIILIIFRYYLYRNKRYYNTPILLLICGLILLIPKAIIIVLELLKLNSLKIPYLKEIISLSEYEKLLIYSKLLIIVGIVFLIIEFLFRNILTNISNKLSYSVRNYIEKDMQKDYEIRKENDLKMQEKREKAKNTHVVYCPYCGADNMIVGNTGTCKFCRKKIEYK